MDFKLKNVFVALRKILMTLEIDNIDVSHVSLHSTWKSNVYWILWTTQCPSKSCQSVSTHSTRALELAYINGMQPSFMSLIQPVLFLL